MNTKSGSVLGSVVMGLHAEARDGEHVGGSTETQTATNGVVTIGDARTGVQLLVGMCYQNEEGYPAETAGNPHVCISVRLTTPDGELRDGTEAIPVFVGYLADLLGALEAMVEAEEFKKMNKVVNLSGQPYRIAG